MASIIKADNLQKVSDDSNIIKKCGSTITVGSSGATVSLASGASQTGFGTPSSSVLWCTTAKTSPLTAADKVGYFLNTTGGVITVTLPSSPSAGDVVAFKDYANTFDTNNVTICRGGSKISGSTINPILDTEGDSIKLVYVDATQGWLNVQTDDTVKGFPLFICATGGTISCSGDFRIHTFNADSTFTVNSAPTPSNNNVDYLIIAGGGSGGNSRAGAGGAGGFRESYNPATSGTYTASPLATPTSLPVSVQGYSITVGAGGAIPATPSDSGVSGSVSTFSSITSAGGGGGGSNSPHPGAGVNGGSGGAGMNPGPGGAQPGGTGNTPPVSPPQGNPGGTGVFSAPFYGGGGGGGATSSGGNGTSTVGGTGGNGVGTQINNIAPIGAPGPSPTSRYFTGGGGGGGNTGTSGVAGYGGGGIGGEATTVVGNGTTNTGGGGGGGTGSTNPSYNPTGQGGLGGSGVVIIRYKFQ